VRCDFFRTEIARAMFSPRANGITKIKQLVAIHFGARSARFAGHDVGESIAFIEQEIAQPVKNLARSAKLVLAHVCCALRARVTAIATSLLCATGNSAIFSSVAGFLTITVCRFMISQADEWRCA
jgi:hypothetical protein